MSICDVGFIYQRSKGSESWGSIQHENITEASHRSSQAWLFTGSPHFVLTDHSGTCCPFIETHRQLLWDSTIIRHLDEATAHQLCRFTTYLCHMLPGHQPHAHIQYLSAFVPLLLYLSFSSKGFHCASLIAFFS